MRSVKQTDLFLTCTKYIMNNKNKSINIMLIILFVLEMIDIISKFFR